MIVLRFARAICSAAGALIPPAAFILCAGPAAAQQSGVVFGGGYVGNHDRSVYAGGTLPLPGSSFGHGWSVRGIAGVGRYSYDGGPAAVIDAKYRSGEIDAIYQASGAWGYGNVGVGARYTDTKLSPADPTNRRDGGKLGAVLTADGARNAGPWRVVGFASYGTGLRDYYTRADITRRIGTSKVRLGVEGGLQGDTDYRRRMLGVVAYVAATDRWEIRLSGGRNAGDGRTGAYGALGVARVF